MFGYHGRQKRKANRATAEVEKNRSALETERNAFNKEKEDYAKQKPVIDQNSLSNRTREIREERTANEPAANAKAREFLNQDIPGLTPRQRQIQENQADFQTKRALQRASRNLLGQQSQRNILPGSGVAYAQQRDLNRLANEARGEAQRGIEESDINLALKKLAALQALQSGELTQQQYDRQQAAQELNLNEERRKNKFYEELAQRFVNSPDFQRL